MELYEKITQDYQKIVERTGPETQMKTLTGQMADQGMHMEGKPFPTFLKPYFVDMKDRGLMEEATSAVIRGLEIIGRKFHEGYDFENLVHQDGLIKDLSLIDPIYPNYQVMVRLDVFYYPESRSLQFLEFNCGDPSGMGWHDAMLDMFLELPAIQELGNLYRLHTDHLLVTHNRAMLQKYRQYCEGRKIKPKEKPQFAIVCWNESTILGDVHTIVEYYRKFGYPAIFADPADFVYDGKDVTVDGIKIDAVYRDAIDDFILPQFWPHVQPIIQAYRDGNICFVNPVRAATGDFKTLPQIMTDDKYRHLFNEQDWDVFQQTIPWTRLLKEGKSSYQGENISMVPFVKANKDLLVLKPNEGYGGFGISIGPDLDQKSWEHAVDDALKHDFAVQAFVEIPTDKFPVLEYGAYKGFQPRNVNINFWSHDGEFVGAFLRASTGSIINVHQGGGLVPVFFVEEK